MSRTSDILNRAQSLREQHQNDIDKKLREDLITALRDSKSFALQKVSTICNDIQPQIDQVQDQLQQSLQREKKQAQTYIQQVTENVTQQTQQVEKQLYQEIEQKKTDIAFSMEQMEQDLSKQTQDAHQSLQAQIQSMKRELASLSELSQMTEQQATLRKTLISTNTALASIALILLIVSIYFGWMSIRKNIEIEKMEQQVIYLKQNGGKLNLSICGSIEQRLCVQVDKNYPIYKDDYMMVKEAK